MAITEQTAKNIKRFQRLRISFWFICAFMLLMSTTLKIPTAVFGVIFLILIVSSLTYLITLGQLVAEADKSVAPWVIGTIALPIFGVIISYIKIRGIAIEKGWF
jgi:heme/copper-type cytochrome/quinol oxidase subunit 3